MTRVGAMTLAVAGLAVWLGAVGCGTTPRGTVASAGSWNREALLATPGVTWGTNHGLVQELTYEGEPWRGRPTRVFAYLGRPLSSAVLGDSARAVVGTASSLSGGGGGAVRGFPAMVLVHGGGGRAFRDWAEHWARRGYVALAMDLSGNGPSGRLPDGGPDQADAVKFRPFTDGEAGEMWTHHAVGAVIRGHSLLRSLPDVDAARVGVTGISWGGYLTCIVAGLDTRFRVAVPVYGCGFLGDNSVWKDGALAKLGAEDRERWLRWFDPSRYVAGVRCPILFVNGTTDFAYPLDSYRKTYRLVLERRRWISVAVDRPHGHIWSFPEVDAFVDAALRAGPMPVRMGLPAVVGPVGDRLEASVDRVSGLSGPTLCYTEDGGPWQKRRWRMAPARIEGEPGGTGGPGRVVADLPAGRPLVAYLLVQDERAGGGPITSEHLEIR